MNFIILHHLNKNRLFIVSDHCLWTNSAIQKKKAYEMQSMKYTVPRFQHYYRSEMHLNSSPKTLNNQQFQNEQQLQSMFVFVIASLSTKTCYLFTSIWMLICFSASLLYIINMYKFTFAMLKWNSWSWSRFFIIFHNCFRA